MGGFGGLSDGDDSVDMALGADEVIALLELILSVVCGVGRGLVGLRS